jgi:hypothetical protein
VGVTYGASARGGADASAGTVFGVEGVVAGRSVLSNLPLFLPCHRLHPSLHFFYYHPALFPKESPSTRLHLRCLCPCKVWHCHHLGRKKRSVTRDAFRPLSSAEGAAEFHQAPSPDSPPPSAALHAAMEPRADFIPWPSEERLCTVESATTTKPDHHEAEAVLDFTLRSPTQSPSPAFAATRSASNSPRSSPRVKTLSFGKQHSPSPELQHITSGSSLVADVELPRSRYARAAPLVCVIYS